MPKKAKQEQGQACRVWIELEKPKSVEHGLLQAKLANNMLARLCGPSEPDRPRLRFGLDESRMKYTIGTPMGHKTLVDNGEWFNLEYFGRQAD